MLRTTFLRTPRQLMRKSPRASFSIVTRAAFPHLKNNQDEAEKKEQGLFDSNKKRLDTLEHGKNPYYKQPGMEDLKKKGDDARIEQNRPDDGVY
ncbi:CGH_3_HP_G0032970.mRNA.1.CDS.1 [Saccharomyces cerevisiae]|nr:CGH_3_HP_G0032970.mRNA.1.CDS.1 [Saccharomyces cerevisiae]CAI4969139.1 CGH_1_HP_G0050650.mRNA.1.CDS.1 [Saccharomyces cerevisiae]CAI5000096.1 CGH_1_HP_G0074360.mRNA.1.CDS.1 [Saccharomyces cerevisiae]CAI5039968.1 CGH_1_HP_G0107720.mRNA.1.CDS.1 [Saccharomyces cerevisiae]CAI6485233.1 CGH_3_HP_G0032970.mRNA.1.CDS.1 [Saccharomyces cerevisiae]